MSTLAVFLWLLLPAQDAALPQTPSALVGIWEGIQRYEQVGDCALAGTLASRLKIAVTRRSRRLAARPAGRRVDANFDWTGRIGDGKVVFEAPKQGAVRHQPAAVQPATGLSRYAGDFPILKGGHRRLTLRGTDEPCPEYGCRFDKTMILTWKGPLPEAER